MELCGTRCYRGAPWVRDPMSSGSAAKEFEAFARDCMQLATQADTPELEPSSHEPFHSEVLLWDWKVAR